MTEMLKTDSVEKRWYSDEQHTAIQVVESIAAIILESRPDILSAIVQGRIARENLATIAQREEEALTELGARSDAVRESIVWRVCKTALSEELAQTIKHDICARRARDCVNLSEADRAKGTRLRQMHDWNPRIDAALMQMSKTVLHTKGPNVGRRNWTIIAEQMKRRFDVNLIPERWCRRFQYLSLRLKS